METITHCGGAFQSTCIWKCPEVVLTPWVDEWIAQCVLFCISLMPSGFSHVAARVAVGLFSLLHSIPPSSTHT